MQPFFEQHDLSLYCGDLRDVLPTLPENSVDFVCTDPPYGYSFMEKDWDHEVPGPEYWRAVARVCKPGALMLAFGGTRTYHHLTYAIEQAGWEIRDCLMWLYGQGMPKCGDIGKLIDKSKGAERQVVGDKLDRPGYHLHEGKGNGCYGGGNGLHAPGTDARMRAAQITAPATPEAAKWTGWAMALKPAWEPIVLAMKPLDGTIANNALAWGVAGMNIEASRIGTESTVRRRGDSLTDAGWSSTKRSPVGARSAGAGRRICCLDDEAAALLDAQTGTLTSGTNCIRTKAGDGYHGGIGKGGRRASELWRQRRGQSLLLLWPREPQGARAGQRSRDSKAAGLDEVSAHAALDPGRRCDPGPLCRQRHHAVGRAATRPPLDRHRVERTQLRDRQVSP